MLILKVIAVSLGLTFTLFGYLIHFKKRYGLVNGFEADYRAGRKTESYASQIGLIEFVIGVVISAAAVALIVFE
jgi:hypothetical protein